MSNSLTPFTDFLENKVVLSEAEKVFLTETLKVQGVKKGTALLKEGEISRSFYFLLEGCCRMYYLIDGQEKNTHFYTENQFVSSYESFVHQKPSRHFLECLEACKVVVITVENAGKLLSFSSNMEQLSRIFMEEELILYQHMLYTYIGLNPAQRYEQLINDHPELTQRIPQYHIASFLGVSAETLSRIRQRIWKKRNDGSI